MTATWRLVVLAVAVILAAASCGGSSGTGGGIGDSGAGDDAGNADASGSDASGGDGSSCAQLQSYCASPTDGVSCDMTEAQAVAQLCAAEAGHTLLQSCAGYDILTVAGVDSSVSFVFDSSGHLVGVAYNAVPRGGSCFGFVSEPQCASPSTKPCAADGGVD